MPLKIVFDESVDYRLVKKIISAGYEGISIMKDYKGISDKEVLIIARNNNAIIITEDKDFGELIFSHKESKTGIVLLRYNAKDLDKIHDSIIITFKKYNESLYKKFTVISTNKIRIRDY